MTILLIGLISSIAVFTAYTLALSRVIRSDGHGDAHRPGGIPRSHYPDPFESRHWF